MEHKQRIFWSDLSYDKQEEIKASLTAELKDNPTFMDEVNIRAEDTIREDEEENTDRNLKWHIENIIEKEVEDIINQTFFCQATMEY